jgi:hypothetical protein
MNVPVSHKEIIEQSRTVLLLLDQGKRTEALEKITALDKRLRTNTRKIPTDIEALWEQVGIAASNPDNARYADEVKDELNRVTFGYGQG